VNPKFSAARCWSGVLALAAGLWVTAVGFQAQSPAGQDVAGRFTAGVAAVNLTATVFDSSGRFVPGLRREDFRVYEDDAPQGITDFSADRVPVSLGIVLDTSGSMAGEKIDAARGALDRFLYDLLDQNDEVFLLRFDDSPYLLQGWTSDRLQVARALGRLVTPRGGTAIYDAIAEALPLAVQGRHAKKALLLISDGNDTSSLAGARAVRERVQQSDVLVYAVGVDGPVIEVPRKEDDPPNRFKPPGGTPMPSPFPPGRGGRGRFPGTPGFQLVDPRGGRLLAPRTDDHVNVDGLRLLTDDSGGRTEVVRTARDLEPATTSIANELSRQYQLAYTSRTRADGRWHSIRVEIPRGAYRVRSRTGYLAN
jgi:VWFA-related protein